MDDLRRDNNNNKCSHLMTMMLTLLTMIMTMVMMAVTSSIDLNIGRVYDVHTVKKQLKGAKMSQKVHNVFPYLPPLLGAPSWFQLIKRRFEDSTASNRILFSWWEIIINELRTFLIQNLVTESLPQTSDELQLM